MHIKLEKIYLKKPKSQDEKVCLGPGSMDEMRKDSYMSTPGNSENLPVRSGHT